MSDFKAKMHQIVGRSSAGAVPQTPLGALAVLPQSSLAGYLGPTCKEREGSWGDGREEEGNEIGKGKGENGKGGESILLALILQFDHCLLQTQQTVVKHTFLL